MPPSAVSPYRPVALAQRRPFAFDAGPGVDYPIQWHPARANRLGIRSGVFAG
jgi:hypothetical protein